MLKTTCDSCGVDKPSILPDKNTWFNVQEKGWGASGISGPYSWGADRDFCSYACAGRFYLNNSEQKVRTEIKEWYIKNPQYGTGSDAVATPKTGQETD